MRYSESNVTKLILIAHNLRSAHNVGSLLRTADGLGVGKIYLTGYSPYPQREDVRETSRENLRETPGENPHATPTALPKAALQTAVSAPDPRLPHLAKKINDQIAKTALGAEKLDFWEHDDDIETIIADLKNQGFIIAALEQAPNSIPLPDFQAPAKLALIVGREVEGLEPEILALCDLILEIPMLGRKESFNVAQAAAIALYHCRYR